MSDRGFLENRGAGEGAEEGAGDGSGIDVLCCVAVLQSFG